MGYLRYDLSFDIRSTALALEVEVYWGQALFFKTYVLCNNFQTISPIEQRICHYRVSLTSQLNTGTKVRQLTSVILTPRLKHSEELYHRISLRRID